MADETKAWLQKRRNERSQEAQREQAASDRRVARGLLLGCGEYVQQKSASWAKDYPRHQLAQLEAFGQFPPARTGHEDGWLREWRSANRVLCRRWILRRWIPAARALEKIGITRERVAHLEPPEIVWREALLNFASLIGSADPCAMSRSIAEKVASLREELREERFVLGGMFEWLADALFSEREQPNPMSPAVARAVASLEWVETKHPELVDRRRQWEYIRENGCAAYEGSTVPSFDTWSRYLREGFRSRAPTPAPSPPPDPGRSVVRRSDL